jgi:hypothetical protein
MEKGLSPVKKTTVKMEEFLKANPSFKEEIERVNEADKRLQELRRGVSKILGKDCREDFNFTTGSLIGMLRSIAGDYKNQDTCLDYLGITKGELRAFQEVLGYFPYYSKNSSRVIEGKLPLWGKVKVFVEYLSLKLGITFTEEDLKDLEDRERIEALYVRTLQKAQDDEAASTLIKGLQSLV